MDFPNESKTLPVSFFMKEKNCIPRGWKHQRTGVSWGGGAYNSNLSSLEAPGATGSSGCGAWVQERWPHDLVFLCIFPPLQWSLCLGNSRGDRRAHHLSAPGNKVRDLGSSKIPNPWRPKKLWSRLGQHLWQKWWGEECADSKPEAVQVGETKIFCYNDTYWNTAERPLFKRHIR